MSNTTITNPEEDGTKKTFFEEEMKNEKNEATFFRGTAKKVDRFEVQNLAIHGFTEKLLSGTNPFNLHFFVLFN